MPYGKRYDKKLKKWIVYNKENKKVKGKHPNEEAANKHLAALYANTDEDDMMMNRKMKHG